MKRCPHCHASMLLESSGVWSDPDMVWRCLGCGREIYHDAERQAEDEQLQQIILAERRTH
ncbi:MAG TPA: hypothetical protein VF221_22860 [Chloroflexota bacterium]